MAKRGQAWTEDKIARYLKEGRGQGEGIQYKPRLTIQDVPSLGRVHRVKGNKTGRIHHLLSDLERDYFYLLEWADEVIDIREQFPLHRDLTLQIAEQMNIRHPMDNSTQTPIVMTTDFLITMRRDKQIFYWARTIKPSDQLNTPRIIEKFEIEREYWKQKNVDWGIATEQGIPDKLSRNIAFVHRSFHVDEETKENANELLYYLSRTSAEKVSTAFDQFEHHNLLQKGEALACFKHLLATKQVSMDMNSSFSKQMKMDQLVIRTQEESIQRWAT